MTILRGEEAGIASGSRHEARIFQGSTNERHGQKRDCNGSYSRTVGGMSSADRRKEKKAKKARLQVKKLTHLQERLQEQQDQDIQKILDTLSDLVASGRARIAIASALDLSIILTAMWHSDGVHLQVYRTKEVGALGALKAAAFRHVDPDEWVAFFEDHVQAAMDSDEGDLPVSMIQWKPGEGPNHAPQLAPM
jgi:hypothetical protein